MLEKAIMVCFFIYVALALYPVCYFTFKALRCSLIYSGFYHLTEERIMPKVSEDSERGNFSGLDLEDDASMRSLGDRLWCSEGVKKKIVANLMSKIRGNTRCFSRIDVKPLYRKGSHGYYRVIIYIRDFLWEGFLPANKIWRDYSVEVEGNDCEICNIAPPLVGKI